MYRGLAGGRHQDFDPAGPSLRRAAAESQALEAEFGRSPALAAMLSHPPVLGDIAHLNTELARHGTLAMSAVRGRPCRPRLVAAVDHFALDTLGLAAEGFYAGFVGLYHLGLDRLALARGAASSWLLRAAAWPKFAARMLRNLSRGGEMVMVLAGGVPATARVLYTVREWAAAQRRRSPLRGDPAEVLRRLRQDAGFCRFESSGVCGPALRRSAWRMLEGWAMSALAGQPGPAGREDSSATGRISAEARGVLTVCLECLDLPASERADALAALAEEFIRETPYRRRLFAILSSRILRRGRPLLLLPVVHRGGAAPGIDIRDAWSCRAAASGRIRARVLGEPAREWEGTAGELAVAFGQANYA
jgi:hypothetical protein